MKSIFALLVLSQVSFGAPDYVRDCREIGDPEHFQSFTFQIRYNRQLGSQFVFNRAPAFNDHLRFPIVFNEYDKLVGISEDRAVMVVLEGLGSHSHMMTLKAGDNLAGLGQLGKYKTYNVLCGPLVPAPIPPVAP